MKFKAGDVFEVSDGEDGEITYHIIIQVITPSITRGRSKLKILEVFKMNHLNHTSGHILHIPNRTWFGAPKERWYTLKRLTRNKNPEYFL